MEFMETTQSDGMSLDAEMRCIACGRKLLEDTHSCICGHVHAEKKLIRGKRYSAYREQLYSKMITEQLLGVGRKSKTSRPKCTGNDGDVLKVRKRPFKHRKRNSFNGQRRPKLAKHGGKAKHARSTGISAAAKRREKFASYYWTSNCNFSFALEEINRRLLSQSSFWVRL